MRKKIKVFLYTIKCQKINVKKMELENHHLINIVKLIQASTEVKLVRV